MKKMHTKTRLRQIFNKTLCFNGMSQTDNKKPCKIRIDIMKKRKKRRNKTHLKINESSFFFVYFDE